MSLILCRFIKHLTPSTTVLYDVCDRFLQVMCSLRATIINILGWAQQCQPRPQGLSLKNWVGRENALPAPPEPFFKEKALGTRLSSVNFQLMLKFPFPPTVSRKNERSLESPLFVSRKSIFPARFPPLLL